jgi:hypothetical protein
VYRLNQYEGVIDGQVVETGVSFILTFDYNKLKELFTGRKTKKRIRQHNRQINKQQKMKQREQVIQQANQTTGE